MKCGLINMERDKFAVFPEGLAGRAVGIIYFFIFS